MIHLAPGASLVEVLAGLLTARAESRTLIPEFEDDGIIGELPFPEGIPLPLQSKDR
jgi:hypothetical protein